jgi:hypothetical protein
MLTGIKDTATDISNNLDECGITEEEHKNSIYR